MSVNPEALQAIFNRIESGERLSKRELETLVEAARSQQVTIATEGRAVAIGGSADGTVIVTGNNNTVGNRNFAITGVDAEALHELVGVRPRIERLLLKAVKEEVISRLNQSLHHQIFIQIETEAKPKQVQSPWELDVKIGHKSAESTPSEQSILQVFDVVYGKLLILGKPGAGKTTIMLDLARDLCSRAEQQADFPVPILFNLSTWKISQHSIQDWLVMELKNKYGVRKNIGTELIRNSALSLILDGLDELESAQQISCTQAINQFLQSEYRPQHLVICSRQEEYDHAAIKLCLNGAIYLQDLDDIRIQRYLSDVGQQELWNLLLCKPTLLELVRTPLILNVTLLSHAELSDAKWQQLSSTKQIRKELLDSYVQRMLSRTMKNKFSRRHTTFTERQTYRWLVYLAQQMEKESQTEFFLEQIEPSWLQNKFQNWSYRIGVIFDIIIVFVTLGSLIGTFTFNWELGAVFGVLAGLLYSWNLVSSSVTTSIWQRGGGSNYLLRENFIVEIAAKVLPVSNEFHLDNPVQPERSFHPSSSKLFKSFLISSSRGVVIGIILIYFFKFSITVGLILASISTLISSIKGGLEASKENDLQMRCSFNEPIQRSLTRAILSSMLILGCLWSIAIWNNNYLFFVSLIIQSTTDSLLLLLVSYALILFNFQSSGGLFCIQHFTIKLILYCNNLAPWNYSQFLDYCTDRLLLQRVGGRYRFIHRLLQEHFAAMQLERK